MNYIERNEKGTDRHATDVKVYLWNKCLKEIEGLTILECAEFKEAAKKMQYGRLLKLLEWVHKEQ